MSRLGYFKKEDIFQAISAVEKTILTNPQPVTSNESRNIPNSQHDLSSKPLHPFKSPLKYCKRHGNGSHNTEECRAIKKKDKNSDINKSSSSYVLRVPSLKSAVLELHGSILNKNMIFQLDPGASLSFISENEIQSLGIKPIPLTDTKSVEVASGDIYKINKCVDLEFSIHKIPHKTFTEKFYIIPGKLSVILLGSTFLLNEEVQIDYREARLRIGDHYLFFDSVSKEFSETPDSILAEKALVLKLNNDNPVPKEKLLINSFANLNPELGNIPNQTMPISLTSKKPVRRLPYPIPFALRQALKQEIERLLKLKIIKKSTSPYSCPAFPILKKNWKNTFSR